MNEWYSDFLVGPKESTKYCYKRMMEGNMGHTTASFTLDVYGHVSEEMKLQSAERLDNFIRTIAI